MLALTLPLNIQGSFNHKDVHAIFVCCPMLFDVLVFIRWLACRNALLYCLFVYFNVLAFI